MLLCCGLGRIGSFLSFLCNDAARLVALKSSNHRDVDAALSKVRSFGVQHSGRRGVGRSVFCVPKANTRKTSNDLKRLSSRVRKNVRWLLKSKTLHFCGSALVDLRSEDLTMFLPSFFFRLLQQETVLSKCSSSSFTISTSCRPRASTTVGGRCCDDLLMQVCRQYENGSR